MSKYFNGFDGFDYRKVVWGKKERDSMGKVKIYDGIFRAGGHGMSKKLKPHLLIEEDYNATLFSDKLDGDRPWDQEVNPFLKYEADLYAKNWLSLNLDLYGCLIVFMSFICAVPESAQDVKQICFLPAAKEISNYLRTILSHCGVPFENTLPEDARAWVTNKVPFLPDDAMEWIAAGVYALVALVLQNVKTEILFYRPPKEYDPVPNSNHASTNKDAEPSKEAAEPPKDDSAGTNAGTSVGASETQDVARWPSGALHSPEPELPFDFFEHVKAQFMEIQSANNVSSHKDAENGNKQAPDSITPSAVRQQKTTILCSFELAEVPGFNSHAFIVEKCVKRIGKVWHPRIKLRKLSRSTRNYGGMTIHTFLLHQEQMSSDTICEGIIISVETNGTRCRLYSFDLTSSGKWNKFDSVSIRPSSWRFTTVDIDKDGYLADREMEDMLDFCDVRPSEPKHYPLIPERTAISRKMDPDFLDFRVLDWNTQKEIPKYTVRDQITGERQIAITVPCPGQMIVLKMDSFSLRGDLLAVFGNLYGLYGCDQDELEANVIMAKGACENGDPQMAFQYGAYLKCKGYIRDAESYLRIAAKQNIPGAKFELAELLMEQKNSAEVRQLIDDLWSQGFRTHGTTQSIDLLGEHTQGK